jgi:hypothetical protein
MREGMDSLLARPLWDFDAGKPSESKLALVPDAEGDKASDVFVRFRGVARLEGTEDGAVADSLEDVLTVGWLLRSPVLDDLLSPSSARTSERRFSVLFVVFVSDTLRRLERVEWRVCGMPLEGVEGTCTAACRELRGALTLELAALSLLEPPCSSCICESV